MNFIERLKDFRLKQNFKSKREFAKALGVSENVYYMVENGTREPSKNFLEQLVIYSSLPTEYWLYGIDEEKQYLECREELKMLNYVISNIIENYKENKEFTEDDKKLILLAAKADIEHLIKKQKQD